MKRQREVEEDLYEVGGWIEGHWRGEEGTDEMGGDDDESGIYQGSQCHDEEDLTVAVAFGIILFTHLFDYVGLPVGP